MGLTPDLCRGEGGGVLRVRDCWIPTLRQLSVREKIKEIMVAEIQSFRRVGRHFYCIFDSIVGQLNVDSV